MEIVLVEPEIPGNTGNIARLCAANHMTLHLVKPLGFSLDSKYLKRAGLDYWHLVDVQVHENLQEVYDKYPDCRYFYATTAKHTYAEVEYQIGDMLVFGKETKGLPEELLAQHRESRIRIPHDRRSPFLEFVEFGGDYCVRSHAPIEFPRFEELWPRRA